MLNPQLDIPRLAREWAADQRVRIANVLRDEIAVEVHAAMAALPYDMIFFSGGRYRVATQQQLAQLSSQQRQQLQQELHAMATRGTGFAYAGYRMGDGQREGTPALLKELFAAVNDEVLDLVSEVTGIGELVCADGQFTRFEPGHYLTRHSDAVQAEHRRVAYVLGMTPDWHPDWGGLLQFFDQGGECRDAWIPRYNTLALFDVRHVHSVTYVAPYAATPRLSLTGWFRDQREFDAGIA
jgi:SM-20-related protein